MRCAALRYFNASGADPDGELGEWHDPETHLIPRALMAAAGRIERLEVYGDDYPTPDGTCVRDYIHVGDLARAHVLAFAGFSAARAPSGSISGRGSSVKDVIDAIARVTGRKVPFVMKPRRPGDPAALFADISLARRTLGFAPELPIWTRSFAPPRRCLGCARLSTPMRKLNLLARWESDGPSGGLLLERILTGRRKAAYVAGVSIWLAALAYFWMWWLRPDHVIDPAWFVVISAILAWTTLMPLYFVIIFYKSVKPAGPLRIPSNTRVAMVVTKAPSEPFDVVADTLLCMLAQDHPHDNWLADEDTSPATLAWCRDHGVQVSTRKGQEDYHRLTWPRRTRCKEGNLAFFYDHYGYERYDIVCQLDADHAPSPGYLREMLRPFADPVVGYVSAPSICDKNAAKSWAARGRLYAEANLHGPMQTGHAGGAARRSASDPTMPCAPRPCATSAAWGRNWRKITRRP